MAVSELIVDKLPILPRTAAAPLIGRIISGAIAGGAVWAAQDRRARLGALLGGITAAASAFGFYHLRRRLGTKTGIPDPALGLAEDMFVLLGGAVLADSLKNKPVHH